jgi:hypothetical protein
MSEEMTKHNWTGEPQASDSKSDLKVLRAIAEKATQGEWQVQERKDGGEYGEYMAYGIDGIASVNWYSDSDMAHTALEPMEEEDAHFIATFNPKAVLALLDRLEKAERALTEAEPPYSKHCND